MRPDTFANKVKNSLEYWQRRILTHTDEYPPEIFQEMDEEDWWDDFVTFVEIRGVGNDHN